MNGSSDVYLRKAEQSLAGANSELVNGHYDNVANRCYYACFQAAVHTLLIAGIRPRDVKGQWGHDFVQAEFVGTLINRRKRYSGQLRDVLFRNLSLRQEADYGMSTINQTEASRALRRTREFLEAIRPGRGEAS